MLQVACLTTMHNLHHRRIIMNKTITISLALLSDGTVDRDETLATASDAIDRYVAERETEETVVGEAVTALFDEYKGTTLPMPFVVQRTLVALNAQPANQAALTLRIQEHVRSNSQGEKDKATKAVARPDSLYVIGKGKGGGVSRRADMKAAE